MKIRALKPGEITFGPGCVIAFSAETHLITLYSPRHDGTEVICWSNGDDKRIAPSCLQTNQDFREVVGLIADMLGLTAVPDSRHERADRPVYRLVERLI